MFNKRILIAAFVAAAFQAHASALPHVSASTPSVVKNSAVESTASAQQDPALQVDSPASKLAALQAQIAVLKAQADVAKLKADIQQSEKKTDGIPPAPGTTAIALRGSMAMGPDVRVMGISGFDGRLSARLKSADGREVSVTPGQSLPGHWYVDAITQTSVVIERGHARRVLTLD